MPELNRPALQLMLITMYRYITTAEELHARDLSELKAQNPEATLEANSDVSLGANLAFHSVNSSSNLLSSTLE